MSEIEAKVEVKAEEEVETTATLAPPPPQDSNGNEQPEQQQLGHGMAQGHFSSEIYKIEIANIPKVVGYSELKKYLAKMKIKAHKIKFLKKIYKCYVTFNCEEEREAALGKLNGTQWKKNVLQAKPAKAARDAMAQKETITQKEDNRSDEEKLLDAVCPWRAKPYVDQLREKYEKAQTNCKSICILLKRACSFDTAEVKWPFQAQALYEPLCFPLQGTMPAEQIRAYRNKCEFTFGFNGKKEKTIGFRTGRYKDGTIQVESAAPVPIVSETMKRGVAQLEQMLLTSQFNPYSPADYTGHWLTVMMREGGADSSAEHVEPSLVAYVTIMRNGLSDEQLKAAQDELKEMYAAAENTFTGLILYWREVRGKAKGEDLLSGSPDVQCVLMNKKFKISPSSFFQTHYRQCERLYTLLADWSLEFTETGRDQCLLDICCGTGSIGIALSDRFAKVFGVEMVPSAIRDANYNVSQNNLSGKCAFICGKAEDKINEICATATTLEMGLVCVLDPPRGGMPLKVITTLRRTTKVESLVYVSCDASNTIAQGNIVSLCRDPSNSLPGEPFRVVRVQPVDLFPLTPHHELVFLLLRGDARKRFEERERDDQKEKNVKEEEKVEEEMKTEIMENDNKE